MVEPFITARQVAEMTGKHYNTVLRWAAEGTIPAHRFGRDWMFLESEIRALPVRRLRAVA